MQEASKYQAENMSSFKQPLKAKIGEVNYRKELFFQHIGQDIKYKEEYSNPEISKILKDKAIKHLNDFKKYKKEGIILSPYLEIGSGYCQTTIMLENKLHLNGYATDISLFPLTAKYKVAKILKLKKTPKTIVCDAENLPFKDSSFPLVFTYQTLHHFPNPKLVIEEAYRVLAKNGVFLFPEEPITHYINIELWRRPTKIRWWEKILKKILILHFISKIGKTEIDNDIIEETFTLDTWKKSVEIFETAFLELRPFAIGPYGLLIKNNGKWQKPNLKTYISIIFIFLLGGGITGKAIKKSGNSLNTSNVPKFVCVNCNKNQTLYKDKNSYYCQKCKRKYRKIKNAFVMLNKSLESRLYK